MGIVLSLSLGAVLVLGPYKKAQVRKRYKNCGSLWPMYGMTWWLIDHFPGMVTPGVRQWAETLYGGQKQQQVTEDYYIQKGAKILGLTLVGEILIMAAVLSTQFMPQEVQVLQRPQKAESEAIYRLEAHDQEQNWVHETELTLEKRVYEEAEVLEIFQIIKERLPEAILGENPALNQVSQPLNLITTLDNYDVQISWSSQDYSLITPSGTVNFPGQAISQVELTARLSYGEEEDSLTIPVTLIRPRQGPKALWEEGVDLALSQANQDQKHAQELLLPEIINGRPVNWQKPPSQVPGQLALVLIMALVATLVLESQKFQNILEKRNQELMQDYPAMVHKLVLFLNAGMTVRGAWGRMVEGYLENRMHNRVSKHWVYEEMNLSLKELESGYTEAEVYERFGRRLRLQPYLKLSAMLIQYLKKGAPGTSGLLLREAEEAMLIRKETAKRAGETAGTKLLGPMMVMLILVMGIIIFPAFTNFGF